MMRPEPAASIPAPAPVRTSDRIETLDILRGFAVLGILAVNAMAFAWPGFVDPTAPATPFVMEGAKRVAVWANEVFFHSKFRTLFSMLFGVSIFLIGGERSDIARGRLLRRRLAFLALFGLIHGLALWYGDILLLYAWSGLFMMLARSWTPRKLMATGLALVAGFALLTLSGAVAATLYVPSEDPEKLAAYIHEGQAAHRAVIEQVRSGFGPAMLENLKMWAIVQGTSLVFFVFQTVGLMMIGLSLFKTGFLAGRSSSRTYGAAAFAGLIVTAGLGLSHWMVLAPGEAPMGLVLVDTLLAELAPVVTLAWAALLILMTRRGWGLVSRRLAPVGRMAFTNYLTQSLIMASLFYLPWGPKFYGQVGPAALWLIVLGVWALQLVWSPLWLSRFEMGPLEWVWRCLTYRRRIPFLKAT